ncbi:MAG: hypothetical protein ACRD35_01060 [Candidatus Acidiferrales bacterium]
MSLKNERRLLELAPAEITVPLKVTEAGRTYRLRHTLRPAAAADWFAYEAALEMAVEEFTTRTDSDEPCYRLRVRSSEAALLLWERLALRVEGYEEPAGVEIPSSPLAGSARLKPCPDGKLDWRALIPLAHKEAAIAALTLVAPATPRSSDPDADEELQLPYPLLAEERRVVLEAVAAGVAYPQLVHRFRPPSVEAERAYRRLVSETLLVRGARTPRTLLPARLPALVRLYDELILGAEGYCLNGEPLASSVQVTQRMDAWHKRVAVQALFGDSAAEVAPRVNAEATASAVPAEVLE